MNPEEIRVVAQEVVDKKSRSYVQAAQTLATFILSAHPVVRSFEEEVRAARTVERAKYPLGQCCVGGRCEGEGCPCVCHPGNPDQISFTHMVGDIVVPDDGFDARIKAVVAAPMPSAACLLGTPGCAVRHLASEEPVEADPRCWPRPFATDPATPSSGATPMPSHDASPYEILRQHVEEVLRADVPAFGPSGIRHVLQDGLDLAKRAVSGPSSGETDSPQPNRRCRCGGKGRCSWCVASAKDGSIEHAHEWGEFFASGNVHGSHDTLDHCECGAVRHTYRVNGLVIAGYPRVLFDRALPFTREAKEKP